MARLTARENTSPSSSVSPPVTPISQSPGVNRNQSPLTFETQGTPTEEKCFSEMGKSHIDNSEPIEQERPKSDGIFKEPSKPIDIHMPSSSKGRSRAPPQRSDSETSSIHMEVDEVSGCADKVGANTDIDSGFENMEVRIALYIFVKFEVRCVVFYMKFICNENYYFLLKMCIYQ